MNRERRQERAQCGRLSRFLPFIRTAAVKRKCRGGDQTLGRDKKGRGRRRRGKNRSSVRRSQHLPLLQGVETRTSVLPPSSLCLSGISLPLLNASYDYRNFISFIRVKSKKFSIQRIDRNFITRRSEASIDRSITIVLLRSTAVARRG